MTTTTTAQSATTFTDFGYCFAHHGQTEFTVTHHGDGQETVTCETCGAQGFGPAVQPVGPSCGSCGVRIGRQSLADHYAEAHPRRA